MIIATLASKSFTSYVSPCPQYYKCDPQDFTGTAAQKDLVIGGTGCMWGEWVDGTNLLSRTWYEVGVICCSVFRYWLLIFLE